MRGICEKKHEPVAYKFPVKEKKRKKTRNLFFSAAQAPSELVTVFVSAPALLSTASRATELGLGICIFNLKPSLPYCLALFGR